MDENQVQRQLEVATAAVDAANTAVTFAIKQQFKYFCVLGAVAAIFALSLVGIVAIDAWEDSQVYTEVSYEAVGSMGDSNNINTGDGSINNS